MKLYKIKTLLLVCITVLFSVRCNNDDDGSTEPEPPDFSGTYVQEDQMGRPAINTVFVSSDSKDTFNTTIPFEQNAAFQAMFQTNLETLSPAYDNPPDTNLLGLDATEFSTVLATDVLNVITTGSTEFFIDTNPGNYFRGRNLDDDVINVALVLIFGGTLGNENPGLTNDNVNANDKTFLSSFPYLAAPW